MRAHTHAREYVEPRKRMTRARGDGTHARTRWGDHTRTRKGILACPQGARRPGGHGVAQNAGSSMPILGPGDYVSPLNPTPYTPQGARLEPHKGRQRAHKGPTRHRRGLTQGDTQGRGSEGSRGPLWALWPWLVLLGFHVGTHTGACVGPWLPCGDLPGLWLVWACVRACVGLWGQRKNPHTGKV